MTAQASSVTAKRTDQGYAFAFPDQTYIEVIQPARDRHQRLFSEVVARAGNDRLINRARIDLLNLRDRQRFHEVAASVDGTVDWQARLLFVLEQVSDALDQAQDDGEPPADVPAAIAEPVLDDQALYGLAGEIVRAIDPYTEADPVATLLNILVGVGNLIGDGPHAQVQHDHHPARLRRIEAHARTLMARRRGA